MARFPKWDSLDYTPTTIVFRSKTPLSPEEQTALTEYIRSFPNPTSFLELEQIDNYPSQSMETNAQDLTTVSTFINSSSNRVLDALKTVVQFRVPESFSGTAMTLRFQVFDRSRRIIMADWTLNVGSLLNRTGPQTVYQSVMISDLSSNAVNYDTVWHLNLAVSSPAVYVSLHGLQLFFYIRHTA
ncbi:hypothetical protein HK102_003352 [Quaeritorhiza haematococci]|nr:hypothetical protein HK102_003352 [Quaeritorhiza haematococci]